MTDEMVAPVDAGRVWLRCPEPRDAAVLARLVTPAISQWLLSWPDTIGVDETAERIRKAREAMVAGKALFFVLELKADRAPIGWISTSRWVRYPLHILSAGFRSVPIHIW